MSWRDTLRVRLFGRLKIPMIAYVRPRVVACDDQRVVVRLPLTRRAKNHHGSMYFGALAVGADLAAGYLAMRRIQQTGRRVSFVFQAVEAEFLRRPDAAVDFVCDAGDVVRALVDRTLVDGERHSAAIPVTCHTDQVVARFVMTLSVKAR